MTFDRLPDETPSDPLVGRCFMVYDGAGRALSKGLVIGRVSPETYLVRHFSWTTGELSTARVVNLSDMVSTGLKHERRSCYEFFEDQEHLDRFVEERMRAAATARPEPPQPGAVKTPAKPASAKAASKKPLGQKH